MDFFNDTIAYHAEESPQHKFISRSSNEQAGAFLDCFNALSNQAVAGWGYHPRIRIKRQYFPIKTDIDMP